MDSAAPLTPPSTLVGGGRGAAASFKRPPGAESRVDPFFSEPAAPATNPGGTATRAWPALHCDSFFTPRSSPASLPAAPSPLDGGVVGLSPTTYHLGTTDDRPTSTEDLPTTSDLGPTDPEDFPTDPEGVPTTSDLVPTDPEVVPTDPEDVPTLSEDAPTPPDHRPTCPDHPTKAPDDSRPPPEHCPPLHLPTSPVHPTTRDFQAAGPPADGDYQVSTVPGIQIRDLPTDPQDSSKTSASVAKNGDHLLSQVTKKIAGPRSAGGSRVLMSSQLEASKKRRPRAAVRNGKSKATQTSPAHTKVKGTQTTNNELPSTSTGISVACQTDFLDLCPSCLESELELEAGDFCDLEDELDALSDPSDGEIEEQWFEEDGLEVDDFADAED